MKFKKIYSYSIIILFSVVLISCSSDVVVEQTKARKETFGFRPNILCVVAEDISPYLGCFGDTVAVTPNLDQLASEGVRFTNVFSVAGVCAPSRNALITGMYPTSIGGSNMRTGNKRPVENQPDSLQVQPYESTPPPFVKCYTEYLRQSGYYCSNNAKEDYQFNPPLTAWDESSEMAHWRDRQAGQPFLAIFNFIRSHESQVNVWKNEPSVVSPDMVSVPPYYPDTYNIRRDIARMHTNNTIMDREVGEIIQQLKDDGLYDSTIIIFYSDHGGPLPRGKREIKDSGLKVPLIIRFPGGKHAGLVVDDLISFVDFPPTLLSLAGVEIPEHIQGQAFWGAQTAEPREYIYAARDRMDEWFDCRRAVRDKKFKYIRNYRPEFGAYMDINFRKQLLSMQELLRMRDAGELNEEQMYWFRQTKAPEELYNLQNDPHELNNLANDPAYQSDLERLRKAHEEWVVEIDDKGVKYNTEKALMLSMWPDGIQPETENPVIESANGKLTIKCATEGASIGYKINPDNLKRHTPWLVYSNPINVQEGDTLLVFAHRIGFKPSEVFVELVK